VEQLEEPFAGIIRVQPSLITKVEVSLEKEFGIRYPDVQLPCEADGTPNA
jgi:hypothetical protein